MSDEILAIGIDPGLAHVGLALVCSASPGRYEVRAHAALETTPQQGDLPERLVRLAYGVRHFLDQYAASSDAVVIENTSQMPDSWRRSGTNKKAPRDIGVVALATGVIFSAAWSSTGGQVPELLDVSYWMPRERSGRGEHTMARERTLVVLRQWIDFPPMGDIAPSKHEHVVMAAGVARRWIEDERLRRQRERQGITIGAPCPRSRCRRELGHTGAHVT